MKTYAPKTKALAADVILEAAVRRAVEDLRGSSHPPAIAHVSVVAMLRAAGESAELLLEAS